MKVAEPNARDAKLIQYLNEAYGKEKQLETALQAHIAMTARAPYKKRLQQHLKETKGHSRAVERRIKQLGGSAQPGPLPGPGRAAEAAGTVQTAASKAAALAKGPLHAVRGTGEQEKLLKNAKTEYQDEAEEIATYTAIETFANSVGDRDTVQLARGIRREEERMAKFLEKQIPTLTKAVVQDEIPAELRKRPSRRRGAGTRRGASATQRRGAAARGRASGSRRSATARSGRGRSRGGSSRSRGGGSSGRSK